MELRAGATGMKSNLDLLSFDLLPRIRIYIEEKTLLPLTWFVRAGFLLLIISRPLLPSIYYRPDRNLLWWPAMVAYAIYLLALGGYAWRNVPVFISLPSKRIQIVVDICFAGLFFFLNGDYYSNLVLAALLPLLIATRYFNVAMVIKSFLLVLGVLLLALVGLNLMYGEAILNLITLQVFLVKALLFICVIGPLGRSEFLKRQLKEQRRAYRRRLSLLVAQVELAQQQDIDSLVQAATGIARKELRAESVSLFIYQDGQFRRQKSAGIEDDWFSDESYAPGEGITGRVGIGQNGTGYGNPILENHVQQNPGAIQTFLAEYRSKLRSGKSAHLIAVPINGSNRTFGILRAVNKLTLSGDINPDGFTTDDLDMLSSIGALVAFAYSSARREQKMQAILEISETLTKLLDEQRACQTIADAVVGLGYPVCCVLLREANDTLRVRALSGLTGADSESLHNTRDLQHEQSELLHPKGPRAALVQTARWPALAARTGERNLYSVLRLPLCQQEREVGILEIYGASEHDFYPDEIHTLEVFAAQATMAIVNARLSEQNQDQFNQLKELADIISSMIALDDHSALFEYIAHRAAALLHAEDCSLFWVNRERDTIDLKASHSIPCYMFVQKVTPISAAQGSGLPAYVAATGEPLCFLGESYKAHSAWDGRFLDHLTYLPSKNCSSLVLYPIRDQRGAIVGVIKAENKFGPTHQDGFTLADQELLDLLTTQISIAVDKIDRIQKLHLLHESAQMITEVGEQREVLQRIAKSACQVVRADLAVILPYDAQCEELLVDQAASYGQATNATRLAKPREHGPTRDTLQSSSGYTIVEDLENEPSKSNDFTKQEGVRAFIAVALKARKVPVGILYCDFRRPRHFAPEEIRNTQAFGELAAIAISNAALFTRVNRTVQELTAVQQLTKAALTKVDLDMVLETVVGVICDTLGFEMCAVSLVNEVEQVIETRAGRGIADEWKRMSKHSLESKDIQAWVVRTGQTAVINGWDDRLDPIIYERFDHQRLVRVFTPIYGRSGIIGLVEAGYDRGTKATISDQEVATLDRCLEQIALVIESARLLEQSRRHAKQLETLHEMSQQMDRAFHQKDIPNLLELATDTAATLSGPGASAAIHVYDRQTDELDLQACSGMCGDLLEHHTHVASSAHRELIQQARPQLHSGRYEPQGAAPSACVPLRIGGQTLGTLCVVYNRDHWFTQNEQKILDLCATQAATLIVNTRVHRELTSSLDWLSDEIALSYHTMIGPHLAVVKHTVENLLAEKLGPLTTKQADRVGKAKEEIDMLAHRIERLLMVRRLEAGRVRLNLQEMQLAELIRNVSARLQPWAHEKGIALSWNADDIVTPLKIDREKIESVLDELIVNAIKYTAAGGTIHIRGVEREHRFLFCVTDTGSGIARSQRSRIFEKYYQVSAFSETNRNGIGLGLYLARKFVELHRGRIYVRSKLAAGTTFMVTLPKHRGKPV